MRISDCGKKRGAAIQPVMPPSESARIRANFMWRGEDFRISLIRCNKQPSMYSPHPYQEIDKIRSKKSS
jgi:hypothetical protein